MRLILRAIIPAIILLSVGFASTPTPRITAAMAALDAEALWEVSFLNSVAESPLHEDEMGRGSEVSWSGDAVLFQRTPYYLLDDVWDASLIVHEAGHMRGKSRANHVADFLDECGPYTAQADYLRRIAERDWRALLLLKRIEERQISYCGG